jgi:hypothetical protein
MLWLPPNQLSVWLVQQPHFCQCKDFIILSSSNKAFVVGSEFQRSRLLEKKGSTCQLRAGAGIDEDEACSYRLKVVAVDYYCHRARHKSRDSQ